MALLQNPARCSSTALSTTSQTKWWSPEPSWTSPMYMPGRLRTASSPSSTVMLLASYTPASGGLLGVAAGGGAEAVTPGVGAAAPSPRGDGSLTSVVKAESP